MSLKQIFAMSLIVNLILASPAWADEAQMITMLNDLQKQMSQMQRVIDQQNEKIRNLEKKEPAVEAAGPFTGEIVPPMSDKEFSERLSAATGGADKWLKDLKFGGDLRLRYEAFENHSGHPSEADDRNRFRYRLRYGFDKKFSDEFKIGFAMASGETAGTGNDSGL